LLSIIASMIFRLVSAFALLIACAPIHPAAAAVGLKLGQDGIEIDAGSIGKFVMDYPSFLDGGSKAVHKIIEKTPAGKTATLRYEAGGQIDMALGADGQVEVKFISVPADAKSVELAIQVPIGFNQGGRWKVGDQTAAFPTQKPASPHLFSGNAMLTEITNYEGKTLELKVPQYGSFIQITDNREWQWSIFHWKAFVPIEANKSNFTIDFRTVGDSASSKPLVDSAVGLKLAQSGIEIDAGSIGKFVMDYPSFLDAGSKSVHKLIEKTPAGKTATLRYEAGGQIDMALGADGQVEVKFISVPADAKSVELAIQVPIGFNQGGKWKVGDKTEAFPTVKPATPHLFSGNAILTEITNYEGKTLQVKVPQYGSFIQITDNREWQWSIFHWKAFVPIEANKSNFAIGFRTIGDGAPIKPLMDLMGQSNLSEWQDKVKSVDELKADVAAEENYYAGLQPPTFDAFGGLPGSKEKMDLKATGFFHIEKKDGRSILVDPLGNAYFHLGVCGMLPNDDYTLVTGRETAYEWLPEQKGEFASVFRTSPWQGGTVLSFHLANQVRKYGVPYAPEGYTTRMIERLRKWGFNSVGAFTEIGEAPKARKAAQFATVAHLPLNAWDDIPRVPGIHETFDPFDEKTRSLVQSKLAGYLPAHANDPLIIGWYIVNEPLYEQIPTIVPSLKGSAHACKRRLVQWLEDKYKTVAAFNTAWGTSADSFSGLLEVGLPMATDAAKADAVAFASLFLDEYLKIVATEVKKHDPNHLLIGSRLQPATISHEWICRALGRHLDVMSYNYYTYPLDQSFLKRIHDWTGGLPMILSEFFWSSPTDSGLTGGRELSSQKERGLAYRNYVEQAAALGFVVGIEWFTLVDQSATGRWFSGFDGERANSGLISVTDRPWKDMLNEAMKTNYGIYDVYLGLKPPFVWEDARVKVKP